MRVESKEASTAGRSVRRRGEIWGLHPPAHEAGNSGAREREKGINQTALLRNLLPQHNHPTPAPYALPASKRKKRQHSREDREFIAERFWGIEPCALGHAWPCCVHGY